MKHSLLPSAATEGRDLIDHAATSSVALVQVASVGCGSVKIAGVIKYHGTSGTKAVLAAGKVVHHRLDPTLAGFRQQEHDPATISTASSARSPGHRGAVKISLAIQRHPTVGILAIVAAGETVEHGFFPLAPGEW